MSADFEISLAEAVAPLVLALDVGSTASRGMLYDAHGRPTGKRAKESHEFTVAADGTSTIDPDQVVAELTGIIGTLVEEADGQEIAGVALDTFASSLVVVGRDGRPLTPCFTYADSRCGPQVQALRGVQSEAEVQQRTGTRIHSSYWPARLRWLHETQPDVVAEAAHYLSLGDYVLRELTDTLATGTSTAAWTGLVDRTTADWSAPDVEACGIRLEQLAPIHHLDQPLELSAEATAEVAKRWPGLADARWFATVADGFAANVGLGAADETTIGASCATSGALRVIVRDLPEELPPGLWCYRVSHDRSIVGGALNDVGRALSWADETLDVDEDDLAEVLSAEPQDTTPLVLPFFTGERSTGWAADAHAVFTGVGSETRAEEVYRGVVEGIALAYARVARVLHELAPQAAQLHCGGRVSTERPELLQAMADAMNTPVTPVTIKRSTLHGTALLALETLAPDVERAVPDHDDTLEPDEGAVARYGPRAERFERVYEALFG